MFDGRKDVHSVILKTVEIERICFAIDACLESGAFKNEGISDFDMDDLKEDLKGWFLGEKPYHEELTKILKEHHKRTDVFEMDKIKKALETKPYNYGKKKSSH